MLVSIITPSFNSAETINRCIESVACQDYEFIEHIIVDGGSSDGTLDIIANSGVRFISESDSGIYHAMNKGIMMANGDVIHILNSDDWYANSLIVSKMIDLMILENAELCHAKIIQVDSSGRNVVSVGSDIKIDELKRAMKVAHPSCFVRSSVYKRFGFFSQGFKIAGDYDFVLRVWGKIRISYLPDVVVKMQMDGVSNLNPIKSYRDSLAVSLAHGNGLVCSIIFFYFGCFKHFINFVLRNFKI